MKEKYKKIKKIRLIRYLIAVSIFFMVVSLVLNNLRSSYEDDMLEQRRQKDEYFRHDDHSPIEDTNGFSGLDYYVPDKNYKVKATLELLENAGYENISRNDGKKDKYLRFAYAKFKLQGKDYELLLLRHPEEHAELAGLFLPFTDSTNGLETYGAGRYIDLIYTGEKFIFIDFNLAYNPYCAYNYKYSCPIPPKENHLKTFIMAGEKKYQNRQNKPVF
jgi:uncharacterized protein (DUF1684 family)